MANRIAGVSGVPSQWSFGEGQCRHRISGFSMSNSPGVGEDSSRMLFRTNPRTVFAF